MTTLRQLQCLVAVAETGRYGEAARRLRISQSAVSAQIAGLETRLGVILLERGRHGARLTPAGEDALGKARAILAMVVDLETGAARAAEGLGGLIRLGALRTLGPYLMPRVTPRLHAMFPDLKLFVLEGASEDLEQQVLRGELNVALSDAPNAPAGLESEILFSERFFIAMPVDDPLTRLDLLEPKDLEGRDLLSLGVNYRMGRKAVALAEAGGARVRVEYEGTSLDALRQMAATGLGLGIVTEFYALSEIRGRTDVVARPLQGVKWRRPVHMIWRTGARRIEDYRSLADALRQGASALEG